MVWGFDYQSEPKDIHCYIDSDNERCVVTRRCTSGGLILHERHLIHMWSWMQSTISLCSELSLNHGPPNIRTVSSAERAMATRTGVGGVKQLEIRMFWLKEDNTAEQADQR